MGFLFEKAKKVYWITVVILLSLFIFTTACSSTLDPAYSAPFFTPNLASPTPPPPTETAVITPSPVISPTPPVLNNVEPVLFAPGSTTTTVKHDLAANESYTYTLYGLVEQLLAVDIAASHNEMVFTVLDATNQALATGQGNQPMRVTLPSDGNYFINVDTPNENGRSYEYSLALSLTKENADQSTITVETTPANPATVTPLPTALLPTVAPQTIAETAVLPQAEPITLKPGETVITKAGQLNSDTDKTYSISGIAGQELSLFANASQPGVIVTVTGLNGSPLPSFRSGKIFDEILPTTQKYLIQISSQANGTSLDYSLTLSLTTPDSTQAIETINPSPNAAPVTINGTLYPDSEKTYQFNATEGQTLFLDTPSNNSDFTISVHGADGIMLGWTPSNIPFSAFLPTTQTYFITLMPATDTQDLNYALTMKVQ